jgi:hypothetical protein
VKAADYCVSFTNGGLKAADYCVSSTNGGLKAADYRTSPESIAGRDL